MSDNERPMKEGKAMNKFLYENSCKKTPTVATWQGWHLRPSSFRSSTITDIKVDTLKFTSKGKVWNNFCAGCSIREMPKYLSPDLYSGPKGQVWGIMLTITNDSL